MIKELKNRKNGVVYSPSFHSIEEPFDNVVDGLAVTPSDMHRMTAAGIPVSPANDALFFDGTPNVTFDLPIEDVRGVDVNDIWNASRDARKKIHKASLTDIQNYGQ